jgi:arginine decarboxylase
VNELLTWNGLPLMEILQKHGTPLRIMYLPKIGEKVDLARESLLPRPSRSMRYQGSYDLLLLHQKQPVQLRGA